MLVLTIYLLALAAYLAWVLAPEDDPPDDP